MSQGSKSIFELSPQRRALLEAMLREEGLAPAPETSREEEDESRIERVAWDGPIPLSFAQQRLWFMQSLAPESTSWHMPVVIRLSGPLDIPALVRAVHDVMALQDTLRTTVVEKNGEASQVILPDNELRVVDLENVSGDTDTFIQEVIQTRFKFGEEPLARAVVFRLSPREHVLVFVLHHIIADGWSVVALQNSLAHAYNNALKGNGAGLTALPVRFSDFVWWERQKSWSPQLDYWEQELAGTPSLRLPFRSSNTPGSVKQERRDFALTERLNKLLYDFCRDQRVTPFSVLLAALQTALARVSGQTDFGIGVPVTNRLQLQLERLIAPLLNTVVLRTPFDFSLTAKALVERVHQKLVEAMDHGEIPFQQVVERLRPILNFEQSPLFQVMASMGSAPALKSELVPGLVTEFVRADKPWLEADLILLLAETPKGVTGSFEFDAAKFDSESLNSFADLFLHLLEQMVSEPSIALRDLRLLPPEQRSQLPAIAETELSETWTEGTAYVLDQCLDLCPLGLVGDLYVIGADGRLYRTGELACRLADGTHEVVKRIEDPAPTESATTILGEQSPETPVEAILSLLWEEVLEQSEIHRDDNFFDLGGQSLSALRLALRIQEAFGIEVVPQVLFDSPTLRGMARKIEEASSVAVGSSSDVVPVQFEGPAPLSFGQERLWFLEQVGGGAQYNIPAALRLRGELDTEALERSLQFLVKRHGALRSAFRSDAEGGVTVQVDEAEFKLSQVDLRGLSVAESRARELMKEEAERPFRLDQPPLMRGLLIRLQESEYYLLVTLHHIAGDAWSVGLLVRELGAAYTAYHEGREPELGQLQTDYGEYARWQRGRVRGEFLQEQLRYWREQLSGAEALRLPVMGGQRGASGAGGHVKRVLSPELNERVRQLGREETATSFMVLLACWQLLLARLSGQRDVTVATPFSNRPRRELEGVVGFFVNTLVLRARLHLGDSFRELVRQVRRTCLEAYAHQELPFERLVEELAGRRGQQRLFQAMFVMQNVGTLQVRLAGLETESLDVGTGTAKVELSLSAVEDKEGIGLSLEYSREVLDEAAAEALLARYEALLQLACENPDTRLQSLPWVGATHERSARSSASEQHSIGAMVQRVVAEHGARVAIQTETETVTYAELAERAHRISRELLQRCGPGPGQVALLCGRGAGMLASVLGTLFANKTYVAIDPGWPIKRIQTIATDAQAEAIVFEHAFREQASFETTIKIDVDDVLAGPPVDPLADIVDPDQLAYILYTSGSTGVPKGVMQSHRNVLTHIENYANSLRLDSNDRLTLFPSYCYDAAVMDIFGALLSGAALYPLDASTTEPAELVERIEEAQITVLHLTPTVFRHLLQGTNGSAQFASVRAVVLGGEEAGPDIFPLFQEHFASGCTLINGLGPTECTLALQYSCTASSQVPAKLPVGRPVEGIHLQLVDENNRPGALEGEIVLSGEQLALGYWCRPEITAEVFSPDEEGRRSYRTGDLGRLLSDGNIEYVGRKDFQVKVQGVRIELYEIEAALLKVSGLQSAVVVVSAHGENKQLWAYYTSTHKLDENDIRDELSASLPLSMVPSRFIEVQEMPLLANGKIDRRALLNTDEAPLAHSFKLPNTWLERALVEIWQQVLHVQPISIDDNFFALGGHSLLALRLLSTVFRSLGCRLPIAALFETPTIESMALRIAAAQGHEQNSALVRMQPKGTRPPIFLVHPAGGDVLCFRHLTLALGNEQPAYGLQDPAIASGDPPLTSIPEIASNYLRAIEAVRPQGPWALGGWSFGGIVAFEMCRQLRDAGEPLPELILFDTWAPGQTTRALELDDASLLAFIARWDFNIEVDVKDLESKTLEEQIAFVSDQTGATARSREHLQSELFRARDILHARRVALISYQPGSYDGSVTLFRAAERPSQQGPDFIDYADNGWSKLCSSSLEVVSVSGSHQTMAEPPHVETLAREVASRLDAAFSVAEEYT